MKPFKQGALDRFCSVYSGINSLVILGYDLSQKKAQALYDYVIDQLECYSSFFDVAENGADYKRLEQILTFINDYLKTTKRYVNAVNLKISDENKHIDEDWNGSTIHYIILTNSKVEKKLPFFAKMHLNNIINDLHSKNFKVKLSWEDRVNV